MNLIVTITADNTCAYPKHEHKMVEIAYYLQGEGIMKTEKEDIPFQKGTIIVIPSGAKHGSKAKAPYKNICVHTDKLDFPVDDFLVGTDNEQEDLKKLAELILRLSLTEKENGALLYSVFNAYQHLVFNRFHANTADIFTKIKSALSQNLGNAYFSFNDFALELGYSTNHLRTLFKEKYGATPNEYLTRLRMEYAKNLFDIYGDKLKICEIAWRCGYQDPLYFSKVFKKAYGVSPRAYQGE